MKPKLVLKIVKLPPYSIAVQVAEQDEELRNKNGATPLILCPSSENRIQVRSAHVITVLYGNLCVRGVIRDNDLFWDHINFESAEERDEWLRKLQNSLDYINGSGEKEVAAPLEIEVLK